MLKLLSTENDAAIVIDRNDYDLSILRNKYRDSFLTIDTGAGLRGHYLRRQHAVLLEP